MNAENMYDAWDNGDRHEIRQQFARREEAAERREWVGLTATEVHETEGYEEDRKLYRFARAIEAKLKEKNA